MLNCQDIDECLTTECGEKGIEHFILYPHKSRFRDICRLNAGSCKQQPNLAPIQSKVESVSFKMQISRS